MKRLVYCCCGAATTTTGTIPRADPQAAGAEKRQSVTFIAEAGSDFPLNTPSRFGLLHRLGEGFVCVYMYIPIYIYMFICLSFSYSYILSS